MTQGAPSIVQNLGTRLVALRLAFKFWRRRLKARLPYVRRSVYRKLEARNEQAVAALRSAVDLAHTSPIVVSKEPVAPLGPELCLFVTYAPVPRLKRHVVRHIRALHAAGMKVILIANTPLPPERLEVEPELRESLAGLYVRANDGFDFAAWAHVYRLLQGRLEGCQRLLLTNDSMVGPFRDEQELELLERARASTADVVGLTANEEPRLHLQSFFLSFGPRALASPAFTRFWHGVRNLPTKDLVIAAYETRLTDELTREGLRCEPLYRLPGRSLVSNDVYYRWHHLIRSGFPFVKTSVLEELWDSPDVSELVPREILDEYEFANRQGRASRT